MQDKVAAAGRAVMAAAGGALRWLQYYGLPARQALEAACSAGSAVHQCMYIMLPGESGAEPLLLVQEAGRRGAWGKPCLAAWEQ